jgi:sugar lactone lactonase YvrE
MFHVNLPRILRGRRELMFMTGESPGAEVGSQAGRGAPPVATQTRGLPSENITGDLEPVAYFDGPMPTGVTVSHQGRIFVNYPKWGDNVQFTVAELRDGQAVAYPSEAFNRTDPGNLSAALVSVQSVVVDPNDRLWMLDTGVAPSVPFGFGGPKLVCVDLVSNEVVQSILFPLDVALPTTYLNDVRFDLRRGEGGMAFITDSSSEHNGIIVVDLATGESWRRLHDHPSTKAEHIESFLPIVEGKPFLMRLDDGTVISAAQEGSDGIAIDADGERLFFSPLGSRRLYSVAVAALVDRSRDDAAVGATVVDEGDRGGAADGLESDATGNIYATDYEHNAIHRRNPDGLWETVAHDPRLLWPDTLSVAMDGYLYVTANQLHRGPTRNNGRDLRIKPYTLFRVRIDAQPVLLR